MLVVGKPKNFRFRLIGNHWTLGDFNAILFAKAPIWPTVATLLEARLGVEPEMKGQQEK